MSIYDYNAKQDIKLFSKWQGERQVRITGLPFSITRPGPVTEEPGGYKGIVVEQGMTLYQPINAADLAEIVVRCLHEKEACNKTFDVGSEFLPDSQEIRYELIVAAKRKPGKYLKPALAGLQAGTSDYVGRPKSEITVSSPYLRSY